MFFILCIMIFISIATVVCGPCERRYEFVRMRLKKSRENLFWNGYLRFIIEGSLEIFIAIALNIMVNITASYSEGTLFD